MKSKADVVHYDTGFLFERRFRKRIWKMTLLRIARMRGKKIITVTTDDMRKSLSKPATTDTNNKWLWFNEALNINWEEIANEQK